MYRYNELDSQLVNQRVAQFRDQVRRWQAGELSDDEFRPLRLQTASTSSAMRQCSASPCRMAP